AAPARCHSVPPGTELQPLLDDARDGEAFCLAAGTYRGPLRITRSVTLWGPRTAVLRAGDAGTTVRLDAPGAALLGLRVDGSGSRFDQLDAAVRVGADGVRVEGVEVTGALFGILVEQARRVTLRGNEVEGDASAPLGMRGDGIRLWEVRESRIEANRIRDGRDLVVWYSPGNTITSNHVTGGRYGTHFMYSHGNAIRDNRYVGNVVGLFLMYSRDIEVRGNVLRDAQGAAGVGLGAKESGGLEVTANVFRGNTIGAYLDTSPLDLERHNRFERNAFELCGSAVVFHGGAARNAFHDNAFRVNDVVVRVEGRGSALDARWLGNAFDDYAGYDLDGDGFGDVPYELRSLGQQLTSRFPELRFFLGTPALALVELVGRVVPAFQPPRLLVDPQPRL
ncbi:MAG: nitrous oxide reductase family maturation protein NosD, partial [Gammaproteobacteria bacterium]|nr:nitrous oxide reductase family maturation protein NosD [Gammaproteobacteria bacterium]